MFEVEIESKDQGKEAEGDKVILRVIKVGERKKYLSVNFEYS